MDNNTNKKINNKKFIFSKKKDCCLQSLNDVNLFLCNIKKAKIALCLFKWFR